VLEVPTDRYIVAAVSGHATMNDSDDKTEMSTRESESVKYNCHNKERAENFKTFTQYFDSQLYNETLDVNLLSTEETLW
jgi:hypothetical protein